MGQQILRRLRHTEVWDNDKQNRGEALGRAHRDLPGPDVFTIGYVRPNTTGPNGGEISGAGDVDWYAGWLSDATVRITLDGMPGFGQPLNDLAGKIQFSVHKRNQSLGGKSTTENDRDATATASPGSQIVELTYTPPSVPGPGIYWIAVSARDGATGRYKLAVNNA